MNGQQIIYPYKKTYICDYNTRRILSSGLTFDRKIMNILSNKAVNQQVEVLDMYFSKIENNKMYMYIGSLQYFYYNKDNHESLDVLHPHYNVEK